MASAAARFLFVEKGSDDDGESLRRKLDKIVGWICQDSIFKFNGVLRIRFGLKLPINLLISQISEGLMES